ncbi:geranylgeranyl reductase family protein [Hymenobacter lutimineralis]|uniref:Geranylgeranyl reductase family protein n=1 Tax=Hymenobacter lutimineralis TaxID=2606448 RepID=A0A5D6UV76_9BACT|nr:geranylgeranyl reductase family protein [Hymenobacter lutimineralis]TYZ06572.1 geranylgeranyl reductase family protein [Hymenobacter lutimineralis]
MYDVDICVLGAGPAGATAALHLAKAGVPCLVVDRAVFPRDKICGDALGSGVLPELALIDAALPGRLAASSRQLPTWGVHFSAPNGRGIQLPALPAFTPDTPPGGHIIKRLDFDLLLVEELRQRPEVTLLEGVNISRQECTADGRWLVESADGQTRIRARLLLVANGAQSAFSRQVGGHALDPAHHCAGLRVYYRGVRGLHPHNYIELHFHQEFLPGYLWIFPLPNGEANVGVGMLTSAVAAQKVNLRERLQQMLTQHPALKERFADAEPLETVRGFGLPLGSKRRSLSGEGYLLLGDAGSLIDPVTGEGISNAMLSGRLAAATARQALAAQSFGAGILATYDDAIHQNLGRQLELSYRMQRLLRFPRVINFFANRAANNPRLSDAITNMFLNRDLRQQLWQPGFYVRQLLGPRRGPVVRAGIRMVRELQRWWRK